MKTRKEEDLRYLSLICYCNSSNIATWVEARLITLSPGLNVAPTTPRPASIEFSRWSVHAFSPHDLSFNNVTTILSTS